MDSYHGNTPSEETHGANLRELGVVGGSTQISVLDTANNPISSSRHNSAQRVSTGERIARRARTRAIDRNVGSRLSEQRAPVAVSPIDRRKGGNRQRWSVVSAVVLYAT